MTFAVLGDIRVNVRVDSRIDSVTVRSGNQTLTYSKDESTSLNGWVVGSAYVVSATGVATGYTPMWEVSTNGVVAYSGGTNNTINLSSPFNNCVLRFYGDPNKYQVELDRQEGVGGSPRVTATYDADMPSATMPTRQ